MKHRNVAGSRSRAGPWGCRPARLYAWRARPESSRAQTNRALTEDIRLIHEESSGTYGAPRIHAVLRGHGRRVGRSRIERLMRRAGIRGLATLPRRTRTTDSRHSYPIAPNRLARNFMTRAPNQVWLADLTYIPTGELALPRRRARHAHPQAGRLVHARDLTWIALEALTMAIERQRPTPGLIHHSDRGIQYAAEAYRAALATAGITPSMSRKEIAGIMPLWKASSTP